MTKLLVSVVALTLAIGLVACVKREEKLAEVAAPATAASNIAPATDTITVEQKLDAMLRGHPNSRMVCVDGARQNAFFLDYGPPLPAGAEPDGKSHGWLFIEKVEFYKTSNNTYFITGQGDDKYVPVYPDINGLQCKTH